MGRGRGLRRASLLCHCIKRRHQEGREEGREGGVRLHSHFPFSSPFLTHSFCLTFPRIANDVRRVCFMQEQRGSLNYFQNMNLTVLGSCSLSN